MQGSRISEMASLSEEAERLLRPAEVAERLDVSIHTLKVWRHRKPPFGPRYKRYPGERGEVRYLLSDVLGFMRTDLHENYAEELSRRPQDAPDNGATSKGYDSRTGRFVVRDSRK